MFTVTALQMARLDAPLLEDYLRRLERVIGSPDFEHGLTKVLPADYTTEQLSVLTQRLLGEARKLAIECEGDTTPFILLSLCDDAELRASGVREWIDAFLTDIASPAEQRMDAVYALLPQGLREKLFQDV